MKQLTFTTKPQTDYELLDSGGEEKLERFGEVILSRPDPQALWQKSLSDEVWNKANGKFVKDSKEGKWTGNIPKEWKVEFGGLQFLIKPNTFKHTGLFPEQLSNWQWVENLLMSKEAQKGRDEREPNSLSELFAQTPPNILNLFGYTGGATLAAAKAGAEVTHVDASKSAVTWARENAEASGLGDKPIRWMVEDVLVFVEREIKRGKKYDGVIMDPPAFGHGPKNEIWKIEESLPKLIELCMQLLSDKPLFFLINGYASGYSSLAFAHNLDALQKKFGGEIEYGDLTIEEKGSARLLPCGIFARWSAN